MQTILHRKRIAELLAIFAGREDIANIGWLTRADERRLAWGVKHNLVHREQRPWPGPRRDVHEDMVRSHWLLKEKEQL